MPAGQSSRRAGQRGDRAALLGSLVEQACAETRGAVRPELLAGYLPALARAAARGRRLGPRDLERCRDVGVLAARDGVALPAVVDAYLSATRLAWARLPEVVARPGESLSASRLRAAGQMVLRAADDALAAVAEGYADARRSLIRQEESVRREFIDDLLGGHADVAGLVARAERFGLRVTAPHLVAVTAAASRFHDAGVAVTWVEDLLRDRLRGRDAVVATKDGRLVCVVSAEATGSIAPADRRLLGELAERAARELTGDRGGWRLAVGRAHAGPAGVATSYREARESLDLAERLHWVDRVVDADRLAVYRVLLRDTDAMHALVDAVLGPLHRARGGAGPLLETLAAYFASGAVTTETARRLHLSVRAVTYRLQRIHALTGHDPTDPADWLALQVAAAGAQLLSWSEVTAASLPEPGNVRR